MKMEYLETNKNIFVFTLATGVYTKYLEEQIKTWNNFFPNYNKKLIIITDIDYDVNDYEDIFSIKIPNIHYNLMCLSKFSYCIFALDNLHIDYNDYDYFIWVDADTKYLDRPTEVWNNIIGLMDSYDLLVNPYPLFYSQVFGKNMCYNYGERNPNYAGYYRINNNSVNICTNILLCKIKTIKELDKDIWEMTNKDLNINFPERHFSCTNEETYISKIVNDFINEDNMKYNIYVDMFHLTPYTKDYKFEYDTLGSPENQIENHPNIIINSKYNNSFKTKTVPKMNYNYFINWYETIDKIYVIQTKLENKYKDIQEYLSIYNIDKFEYIPLQKNNTTYHISLSHYLSIKQAYVCGYQNVIIIEDNILFNQKVDHIRIMLDYIYYNQNIDLMTLCHDFYNNHIFPFFSTMYFVRPKGMEYIIDQFEKESLYSIKNILCKACVTDDEKLTIIKTIFNENRIFFELEKNETLNYEAYNYNVCINKDQLLNVEYIASIINLKEFDVF